VAVALGVAVGHLVAALTDPARSPLAAAGAMVVDLTPRWLEQIAVQALGTNDKPVLLAGLGLLVAVLSAAAGLLGRRSRPLGTAAVLLLALTSAVASLTRPGASLVDALPSLVGALAAWVAFLVLTRPAPTTPDAEADADEPGIDRAAFAGDAAPRTKGAPSRRSVLAGLVVVGAAAAVAGAIGESVRRAGASAAAALRDVVLPAPADPAVALPADAELGIPGITPFRIANPDFYRVDTALVVPQVDPATWSLTVDGMVASPFTLSYDDILAMPLVERDLTLTCVSNEVGGQYAGNARWLGVRLTDLLARAGIDPAAEQLLSTSVDGWTASTPIAVALDGRDAILAVAMNGEPLPAEHGFPARLVVPGLFGFVSATKWVTSIEATTYAAQQAYWTQRGWDTDAPVRTMARIDVPRPLSTVDAGRIAIGGVTWAQHRGIDGVEVQVDDGPWRVARLGGAPTDDTWRQWVLAWDAEPGRHVIRVRATDSTGERQDFERRTPFPSGATGWHEVVVNIA
jgi:DMSO/TMAO reductase YedYZ molybdopterin-dependent catalytic subunit